MALGSTAGYNSIIHVVLRTNYPPAEALPAFLAPLYPNRTGPLVEWLISKWINGSTPGELSVDMSYNAVLVGTFVAGSGGTESHGTITITAGSGNVGATIAGTLVTVPSERFDRVPAGALAAAIIAVGVLRSLIWALFLPPKLLPSIAM